MKKVLSICLPTYNRAETVYANVKWLLQSGNNDFEVVVSDNCSEDHTQELLSTISDPRFVYFRNDQNYGASYNFHLLYQRARGDYMLLMSDEDFVYLDAIDNLVEYFRNNPDVSVYVGSGYRGEDRKLFPSHSYENGFDALMDIGFVTRYMSGIIMKRECYMAEVNNIPFEESARVFDAYSFMYAMSRLFFCGKTVTDAKPIYYQYRFVKTSITNNATDRMDIYYYEPAGREKQMQCWIRSIATLPLSNTQKIMSAYKVIFDSAELSLRVFDLEYLKRYRYFLQPEDYGNLLQHVADLTIEGTIERLFAEGRAAIVQMCHVMQEELDVKEIQEYASLRRTSLERQVEDVRKRNSQYGR